MGVQKAIIGAIIGGIIGVALGWFIASKIESSVDQLTVALFVYGVPILLLVLGAVALYRTD